MRGARKEERLKGMAAAMGAEAARATMTPVTFMLTVVEVVFWFSGRKMGLKSLGLSCRLGVGDE